MKILAIGLAAAAILAVSGSASAQDMGTYAGVFSSVADGLGGGLGSAVLGGDSVFVYAEGHAATDAVVPGAPATSRDAAYGVQVSFEGPNATQAVAQRDALLGRLGDAAKRFDVVMEVSAASVAFGDICADPTIYSPRCMAAMAAARNKPAPAGAKPMFTARATVRFTTPPARRMGEFLDALHEAGADNIGPMDDPNNLMVRVRSNATAAELAKVPQAVWDLAAKDAIRAARGQASVLAQADGREVGEAHQMIFLTRVVDGTMASVTVAVRFQLVGSKH